MKVAKLERRLAEVEATHRLVVFTFKVFGLQIQYTRLPGEDAKTMLIAAIQSAARLVPIAMCLEAIGRSAARFRAWCIRQRECRLADQSSCPKLSPTRLTAAKVGKIRDIFTSPKFSHFSITAMAMYAKRRGEILASAACTKKYLGIVLDRDEFSSGSEHLGLTRSTEPLLRCGLINDLQRLCVS